MFEKYGSTKQFRNVISTVTDKTRRVFDVENPTGYIDPSIPLPIVKFNGTVKVHGTNTSVTISANGDILTAGRNTVLVPGADNYGFANWAFAPYVKEALVSMGLEEDVIYYGEWVGKGIQKGVAVSELEKRWIVFAAKKVGGDWLDISDMVFDNAAGIYNVHQFPTYEIEIDFNEPALASVELAKLVEEVENECPVGKYFGVSGIGEGIVFSYMIDGMRHTFKVKGAKHTVSNVKTLAPVDVERLNSINEFVAYAVTVSRLEQAAEEVLKGDFDRKNLGAFIKWVSTDIVKEESDVLEKNGLAMKDVGGKLTKAAKEWFFAQEIVV